ncbi:MAG: hypothetical protein ABEJ35_05415 [Halobacteriaceae archaeon]
MNKLHSVGADRWQLPRHAHIVVYEAADGGGLLTIYDCGAAQKPPSAQILGDLVNVRPDADIERTTTGYRVRLREPAILVEQTPDHYVVATA